jgi:hypothetical protein
LSAAGGGFQLICDVIGRGEVANVIGHEKQDRLHPTMVVEACAWHGPEGAKAVVDEVGHGPMASCASTLPRLASQGWNFTLSEVPVPFFLPLPPTPSFTLYLSSTRLRLLLYKTVFN